MQIWTVANQKGGVGKTTTSVTLGGLATERNMRVLLVDIDPHGSMSAYFGFDPDRLEKSSFTLFKERKALTSALVKDLICTTSLNKLDVLPASTLLATLERQAIGQDGMGLVLQRALAMVQDDYDLMIIDSPPLLGVLMINALAACNQLIIPVQTEFLAIKGLERMLHTLEMLGRSRKKPLTYSIVPTMFDRRTQASVTSLRHLRNEYPERLWPGKIPVDTKFRDASKAGVPPHLYDTEGRGVEGYRSLLKWLLSQRQLVEPLSSVAGG